jgi:hypothetical protein
MDTFEFMMQVVPQLMVAVASVIYWRMRLPPEHKRKVVKDTRLGKLGERCIWCAHPGAFCSHKPKHFDTPTKNCYEYGCTNDCPVARTAR